jgi:gas vesicle protein
MRAVGFDYPNTCPKIDKAIAAAKHQINSFLDDLLDEACPLLPKRVRVELTENYADTLYGQLEDIFEETRSTNEDMRREADSQISGLKNEIDDLEHELINARDQL